MKKYLKLIYILSTILVLANCTAKTKNIKQTKEAQKENSEQVTEISEQKSEDEIKSDEEETNTEETQIVYTNEYREWTEEDFEPKEKILKKEKTPNPYRSDNKEYFKKGSLLFYNLNINDSFEVANEKIKQFGVKGLSEIKAMPKELEKLGCKAYVPRPETYKDDIKNDFYIIFKDNKIIRFIKYQADKNNLLYFIENLKPENEEEFSHIEKNRYVSGNGYSYYEEAIENIFYREEFYYLRRMYTIIITQEEYKDYFEKLDRKSDSILEFGDLYCYDLHIKNDIETVKYKLDKNGIKYEELWFEERDYFINYNGGVALCYKGFSGIKSIDKKIEVLCFKDRIVKLSFDPDIEQSYVLLQHFRRNYLNNYDLNYNFSIRSVAFLNRCLILLSYVELDNSIYFLLEDPSIVNIFSHSRLQELYDNKN